MAEDSTILWISNLRDVNVVTVQPDLVGLARAWTIQASNICRIGTLFIQTQK
jgi:hypothetical protein